MQFNQAMQNPPLRGISFTQRYSQTLNREGLKQLYWLLFCKCAVRAVGDVWNIDYIEILSQSRKDNCSLPRQAFIKMCRAEKVTCTFIADFLGRTYPTIIHHTKSFDGLLEHYPQEQIRYIHALNLTTKMLNEKGLQ